MRGIQHTLQIASISSAKAKVSLLSESLCFSIFFKKDDAALQATVLNEIGAPGKLQEIAAPKSQGNKDLNLIEIISIKRVRQNKL